ncbi:MAG: glycosyl transferase family 2 [Herbinix sp.]|nr:glycosyl transferase family 2 [Herbinix sp.]
MDFYKLVGKAAYEPGTIRMDHMEVLMITVSVCMIVKDEEKVLARCLNSLKELADEIIIIDTGSIDATKKIAGNYTDKIYDYTWNDDFSAARNFSFSKATMEYIYVADADEVIDEENIQRFLSLKQKLLGEIEIVQMLYANQLEYNTTYNFDVEYRPKLYKRIRTFQWVEPVHENVRLSPVIYDSEIEIKHMPTSGHANRDFKVFLKTIRLQGILSPKLSGMYARELFIAGEEEDFEEAFDYFYDITQREESSERERKIYECILVKCFRIRGDIKGLMKYCLHNVVDSKASAEVCYELGEYYTELGDYKEAIIWYYNAAYETEAELNIHYSGDYPLQRLAECYHNLGDDEQAQAYQKLYDTWSSNTSPNFG